MRLIAKKNQANQLPFFWVLAKTGIIGISISISISIWILTVMLDLFASEQKYILQVTSPYQRFKSSARRFYFSILSHWHLLYLLYKKGFFPWHIVAFLTEFSLRHILEFDGDPYTGKGGGSWRFRHRILQDYFTAKYFADSAPEQEMEQLVEKHLHDSKWEEIFLIIATKSPDADQLLLLMLKKNRTLLNDPDLAILFDYIEQLFYKSEEGVFANVLRLDLILTMFQREVYRVEKKEWLELIKQDKRTKEEWERDLYHEVMEHEFLRLVFKNMEYLVEHFMLTHTAVEEVSVEVDIHEVKEIGETIVWRNPELQVPQQFFAANLLMLQILNSAACISPAAREYVLTHMLEPSTNV